MTTGDGTSELTEELLRATEWYAPQNAPCFVLFDSLDELSSLLVSTDYTERRRKLTEWAVEHAQTTLARWQLLDRFLLRNVGGEVQAPQAVPPELGGVA